MPAYEFLGDHPDNGDGDWTDSLQGVTHNADGFWIFTQKTRIFKFHISEDLASASRAGDPNTAPMPAPLVNRRCNHFGDPDYIRLNGEGFLFVPVEGEDGGKCQDEPVLAVFRDPGGDGPLEFLDWSILESQTKEPAPPSGRAGWCAISPVDQMLYTSSNKVDAETPIFRYRIDYNRLLATDKLSLTPGPDFIVKDENNQPVEINKHMQGGTFSPDGNLYTVSGRIRNVNFPDPLVVGLGGALGGILGAATAAIIDALTGGDSWKARFGGIRVFDQAGVLIEKSTTSGPGFKYEYKPGFQHNQEPEGITYWDTEQLAGERHRGISGQLHGILLNKQTPATDNIWFKHYSITPAPNGASPPDFEIISRFCVNRNAQEGGEHEVHNLSLSCPHLPNPENRRELGQHKSCRGAVVAAAELYERVDGCAFCAPKCHNF